MSESALLKEIYRVKRLKRKLEDYIEILLSDSEQGRIHIRVNPDKEFRKKVAEAMVKESGLGNDGQATYFVDPIKGVVYRQSSGDWWNPRDSWCIMPVADLFDQAYDFCPDVDWSIADVPYIDMAKGYLQSQGEEIEPDGSIPLWVTQKVVIDFAYQAGNERWVECIDDAKSLALDIATDFALSQIEDEIIITIASK